MAAGHGAAMMHGGGAGGSGPYPLPYLPWALPPMPGSAIPVMPVVPGTLLL